MLKQVFSLDYLLKALALFLAYFIGSEVSFLLVEAPAIFPLHAAVALTALTLGGIRLWPILALAAVVSPLMHDVGPQAAAFAAFGNTSQAIFGAYALRRFNFDPLLRRMRDIFLLIGVAMVISTITPTVTYAAALLGFSSTAVAFGWSARWGGHLWALLLAAPFMIRWTAKPFFTRTPLQWVETLAAFSALLICNYLIFWQVFSGISGVYTILILFTPFFWIALRLSSRFMTLSLVVTNAIAHVAVLIVPPATAASAALSIGERLYQLELFFVFMAIIFYILQSIATERRFASEALQLQISKLEEALKRIQSEDTAKTEFLSTLAHELRNPLAPLLSGLELLKVKGARTPESRRVVDMMDSRVNVMRRLLDDLLDISRISHKKLELRRETLCLQDILKHSFTAINEISIQQTHKGEFVAPEQPLYVDGDYVRLEQIFVNLFKNAVKYTPPGGRIALRVVKDKQTVKIHIQDSGIGIEKEMLAKIFEPFTQANPTKLAQGGTGLGIGLALTKKLVEMHGGTIEAKSDGVGKGSEFIVCLPLAKLVEEITVPGPIAHAPIRRSIRTPSRILIVDDNVQAAEGMGKLLEYTGHRTDMAFSGMDAITRARIFQPDAILLDIGLPDMNGYEVARILRSAENFGGKLVALTGYGQDEDKNRAYDAGFDFHMTKPVSVKDVQEVLAR